MKQMKTKWAGIKPLSRLYNQWLYKEYVPDLLQELKKWFLPYIGEYLITSFLTTKL